MRQSQAIDTPANVLARSAKAPGHWVLAAAGKRILRPGGIELTDELLRQLRITTSDTVVELAPGLGHTAEKVLALRPFTYLGVDREPSIVHELNRRLGRDGVRFVQGSAEDTGLPGETASVLFGEAMLSMQSDARRRQIVEESWRIVRSGGRYGIHELCVCSTVSAAYRRKMEADLSTSIHHGVRLLTVDEWKELMESAGFRVASKATAPMRLLHASRMVRDEGVAGAIRFAWNTVTCPAVLRRVLDMRRTFHRYEPTLRAIAMVCAKEY